MNASAQPAKPCPLRAARRCVLTLFVVLSCTHNILVAPGRGPDEEHHYNYIKHLVQYRSLPVISEPGQTRDLRTRAIAIHPPLYYSLCVPVYLALRRLPDETVQHAVRALSTVMGLVTLLLIEQIVLTLFPGQRGFALAVMGFAAFLPHFQLLSGVINNDDLMILTGTALLLALMRLTATGASWRAWAATGALYGLCLISKASALAFAPLAVLAITGQVLSRRLNWRAWLGRCAAFYLPAAIVGGWWFVRFKLLYGRINPIPTFAQYRPILLHSVGDLFTEKGRALVTRFLVGVQQTVWGQYDWTFINHDDYAVAAYPLTVALFALFTLATVVSLVGVILGGARRVQAGVDWRSARTWQWLLLVADFALLYGALAQYTLYVHPGGYQGGRYLLPSIAAYSTLFLWGLREVTPASRRRDLYTIAVIGLALWTVGGLCNLAFDLNPHYLGPH